jgi:hypothetical protein
MPLEIEDAGDRIVFLGRRHIRGRGSGAEVDFRFGEADWVRRGLIVRSCVFYNWDEALRAAGISNDLGLASEADAPASA